MGASRSVDSASRPRVLLLGCWDSGQSTLSRHVQELMNPGCLLRNWDKQRVYRELLRVTLKVDRHLSEDDPSYTSIGTTASMLDEHNCVQDVVRHRLEAFWNDVRFQHAVDGPLRFSIGSAISYWRSEFPRILADGYTPTRDDMLHTPVRSRGVHCISLKNGVDLIDVADHDAALRGRALASMQEDEASALIFTVSLADFDSVTGRYVPPSQAESDVIDDSVHQATIGSVLAQYVDEFCGLLCWEGLIAVPIIIVFTHVDVFIDKLGYGHTLSTAYPSYAGSSTFEEVSQFVEDLFLSAAKKYGRADVTCKFIVTFDTVSVMRLAQEAGQLACGIKPASGSRSKRSSIIGPPV